MVDVTTTVRIERPVGEVAAHAGDPSFAPGWYVNITSMEWETPPPVAVGSRVRFEAAFLGRTLRYTYEIRELVPGERLVMSTARAVPDADDLHLVPGRRRGDHHDAAQPR